MGSLRVSSQTKAATSPNDRQSGAGNDEVRFKPVLALTLIQNYLQESQAHTQQAQPNEVDSDSGLKPFTHQEGRVKNQEESKNQGDHSHRNVDEENPSPAITVREPTTQGRTDDGRHDHAHAEHGHRHALLFFGKTLQQDGLRDGLQRSPSGALQDAEKHQPGKTGREPAEHGADGEDGHAGHVEPLAAEQRGEPPREREHNGV